LGKRVWEISNIAKLVPEADLYLVRNAGLSSRAILDLMEERSKGLRNFHLMIDVFRNKNNWAYVSGLDISAFASTSSRVFSVSQ